MNRFLPVLLIILSLIMFTGAYAQAPVSFVYSESLIFVKAKINSNRALFTFLLNTGANTTVIDKRTAQILKLPTEEKDTVLGTVGREHVEISKLSILSVGNASVKNIPITIRDISQTVRLGNQKVDGIIGTDFLKNFCYTVDFQTKKITFTKVKATAGKQKQIAFSLSDGIPCVDALLDDTIHTKLHYNSGVSMPYSRNCYVNISYNQWEKLKKLNPYMNHGSYMTGKGVGGNVYMQSVRINQIKLNTTEVMTPYLVIQAKEGYFKNDDAIGFFGNSILEKHKKVTVDFLSNKIILHGYSGKPTAGKVKKKRTVKT